MHKLLLILPLLLSGCVDFFPSVTTYQPITAGPPADQAQFDKDVAICRPVAVAATTHVTAGSVVGGAISGGSQNTSETLVPPIGVVPALGAAGGAGAAVFTGLDPLDKHRIAIFIKCLDKLTERDRSAVVVDTGN